MRIVEVEAFAKVNFGLAVGEVRPDGFHEIETVYQSVSVSDTVVLRRAGGESTELAVSGLEAPDGPENLAWRAAELMRESFGCGSVSIRLEKRIPIAAGLAGGSADAAAVLAGVDALFELGATPARLAELGATLGSDVPFMLVGGTAHGTGRGEKLEPLPDVRGLWLILATPGFAVSAAEAYETARIGLTGPHSFIRVNCSAIRECDVSTLLAGLRNDLEAGVVSARPEVAVVKRALLDEGAEAAVMSGSGPTVIGAFTGEAEARSTASRLTGRGWSILVVAPTGTGLELTTREVEAAG